MAGLNERPDDEGTQRIGYIKALHGLIANREAVESSMARVRMASAGYTDEELVRFAQLIIRSENAPSDWREGQLARLRGREDELRCRSTPPGCQRKLKKRSSWMSSAFRSSGPIRIQIG